jgi:DNA polymerase III delta prime subunit
MKTTSLEILENAELPHAQAHAILKVMELEMASAQDVLATKADLSVVRADLNVLRADLNAGLAALRTEIMALKAETLGIEGKLSRWVLTCILGQTAVLASFGYFLLEHWRR